jgi:uridine kinase
MVKISKGFEHMSELFDHRLLYMCSDSIIFCYSQVLSEKQHELAAKNEYNFDHPDAFDFELMASTLQRLKEGKKVEVPIYNFVTHSRESRTVRIL